MSGSALQEFLDFAIASDSVVINGPRDILNEADKNTYLLRRFLKGAAAAKSLQNGKRIRHHIMFDEQSTAVDYLPGQTFTWENPQVLTEHEIDWRFTIDHMAWIRQEIKLNVGGMTKEARYNYYVDLLYSKEQRLWTSLCKKMDSDLFAVPSNAQMEDQGGKQTLSLAAIINEETNTVPSSLGGGGTWTTVAGINPATETGWQNQQQGYDETPAAGGADWDLFTAFDNMEMDVHFDKLPGKEEFSSKSSEQYFIACSQTGISNYKTGLRLSNDQLVTVSRQDPAYSNPKFSGIDLVYVSDLNTATLYSNAGGTALVSESTANLTGPRYYWINADWVAPVWHSECYFEKDEVMRHPNQPGAYVMPVECWRNMMPLSRKRLGIVHPTTDV